MTPNEHKHPEPQPMSRPMVFRPALPPERPMSMPHQDLAISQVVTKAVRWLSWPGNALRQVLSHKTRRQAQGVSDVA